MDIRRSGYVLLALAYALAVYGHNAFGMDSGTFASILGALALVAAFWWPTIGLAGAAVASVWVAAVYATTDGLSPLTAAAMFVIAACFAALAVPRLRHDTRVVLGAAGLAFAANLWYIWNNVISAWTPQFAFVNIALGLGFAALAWDAWTTQSTGQAAASRGAEST